MTENDLLWLEDYPSSGEKKRMEEKGDNEQWNMTHMIFLERWAQCVILKAFFSSHFILQENEQLHHK